MLFVDKIFREYDIRGVYGKDYDDAFAGLLAYVVAKRLREAAPPKNGNRYRFAVGRDARLSGSSLTKHFTDQLILSGIDVISIGTIPTPLVYYSLFKLEVDGAVSITGSHNSAEYNGFKICIGKSTLHGSQIQKIKEECKLYKDTFQTDLSNSGDRSTIDIITPYIEEISSKIKFNRPLKIILDSGNGTASVVAPRLFEKMGCTVIPMYCELDGTFPNHHPDPTVLENLKDLQKAVLEHKADLGIAYDGDADRIGVVDEKGRPIYGDELMVLFSREILQRKPGSKILFEVKCSSRLSADIKKNGGVPILWKTGHSLIKAKMKEEKAELAGEMSGHMFFSDRYYGYDDAVYASARALEILSNSDTTFSGLLSDLPTAINTPELRVDCEDEIKFKVIDEVSKVLSKNFKTITIDGVRIETEDGWGLIRASNTQPAIVMRFESSTQNKLNELRSLVEKEFEEAKNRIKSGK